VAAEEAEVAAAQMAAEAAAVGLAVQFNQD
jgi:hypothetical protein